MKRELVLNELRGCLPEIRAHGVRALYLFGSTARDAAHEDSDVDIFIEAEQADRFNAFDLIDVKTILEKRLDAHVDLTTRDGLHPRLRGQIEREAIRVF
ncbi:MAG TPA: nucleotidyltransferase domain-containing protein [Roseiarcus sp.]|nr:nucleotidyltransferase domain-containing protein [Roseiarcus sp.]